MVESGFDERADVTAGFAVYVLSRGVGTGTLCRIGGDDVRCERLRFL